MRDLPLMIILEENKMDSAILRGIFEKEYRVVEFQSAEDTVKRLEDKEKVDVILWNMILDFQQKVDLLAHILAMDQYRNTTLIAIVGNEDDYSVTTALEYGAADVISKPFNPELVHRRISHFTKSKCAAEHYIQKSAKVDLRHGSREIDSLTEIYKAPAFYRRTRKMLDEHPNEEYLMMFWNIDCFKVINDLFGRTIGDEVLKELAMLFKETMNGTGTYGRIAADNFACCFPARLLKEGMLESSTSYLFQSLGVEYKVTLHLGIFVIEEKERGLPISQMCDWAKMAAETIKGQYGKQYAFYDNSMREKILEEQTIIAELERALEEHHFFVQIQPIYDANSKKIVSGEALVRWRHPEKGVIPPFKFIPVFEKNGMITKLDYYVWEETCKIICKMKAQGESVPISVNVSRINLANQNLCSDILELLQKYNLTTEDMKLEITESAYTENPDQLMEAVQKLKAGKFDILMDDFGSGYSSLNMLKDLPVDILKVDMRFMDGLEMSEKAVNVVTSIVRMAKWIKMIVVAEGVETEAQSKFLESIGCDRIQGYFYSRPVDEDVFLDKVHINCAMKTEPNFEQEYDDIDLDKCMSKLPMGFRMFMERMVGALGVFAFDEHGFQVMRVNDAYYELMQNTPFDLFQDKKDFFTDMPEEIREQLCSLCERSEDRSSIEEMDIEIKTEAGAARYSMTIRYIGIIHENRAYYFNLKKYRN